MLFIGSAAALPHRARSRRDADGRRALSQPALLARLETEVALVEHNIDAIRRRLDLEEGGRDEVTRRDAPPPPPAEEDTEDAEQGEVGTGKGSGDAASAARFSVPPMLPLLPSLPLPYWLAPRLRAWSTWASPFSLLPPTTSRSLWPSLVPTGAGPAEGTEANKSATASPPPAPSSMTTSSGPWGWETPWTPVMGNPAPAGGTWPQPALQPWSPGWSPWSPRAAGSPGEATGAGGSKASWHEELDQHSHDGWQLGWSCESMQPVGQKCGDA